MGVRKYHLEKIEIGSIGEFYPVDGDTKRLANAIHVTAAVANKAAGVKAFSVLTLPDRVIVRRHA